MSPRTTNTLAAATLLQRLLAPEVRSWRGEEPLWKVFWVYGILGSGIIAALYALAIFAGHLVLQEIFLICSAAYSSWLLVALWRCANNASEQIWGLFARLLTVAWAGNLVMILMFLQLGLIGKYIGR